MPVILKAVALESSWGEWQHRILPIKRLSVRLLIDAEHRCVSRRIQVQPDDVGSLLLEVRVVRGHIALDAMGLEPMLAPPS